MGVLWETKGIVIGEIKLKAFSMSTNDCVSKLTDRGKAFNVEDISRIN